MFNKTSVADIMADFGKKIEQLKTVGSNQNKAITKTNQQIKDLKQKNMASQAEISAATKALNALKQFVS